MPTRIIDTIILIAFSNANDPFNEKAFRYVFEIGVGHDILVPSAGLLEFDLELKTHGVGDKNRASLHSKLRQLISE